MLKNYLKIAWRNLARNKVYAVLNTAGLATAITVAMLIGLWIWDEWSFNSYHKNYHRVAQVMVNQSNDGQMYTNSTVAMPTGAALQDQYKNDFKYISLASWSGDHLVALGDKKLIRSGMWVQPDFPDMFSLRILQGTNELKDPSTLLINESLAISLFGDDNPINQLIRLDNDLQMKIGGVYEDLPHNTNFYGTSMFLPWKNEQNGLNRQMEWDNHNGLLFVQLADAAALSKVNEKIKNLPTPFIKDWKEEIMLHPLDKLHLYSEFINGKAVGGRIEFVWLFGTIGLFVLVLACINFMNLSTAMSEKRAKEVGIRKTVGSSKRQLVVQFLGEAIVMSFLAFLIALALVRMSLPFFNQLSDKQISLPWNNLRFWLIVVAGTIFTGLVSGSYPAFYLSSFRPIKVLKGGLKASRVTLAPRKILVVFQFTICIILIIGTVVVFRQIEHSKSRPAGYSRKGLITVPAYNPELQKHFTAIKSDLLQTGVIENMASSSQSAVHFSNNNTLDWAGKDPGLVVFFRNVNVSHGFGKTLGWTIKQGRDFSEDYVSDSSAVIINETAAKTIGFKNPVGKTLTFDNEKFSIIGVANDMITQSPYSSPEASVFFLKGWKGVFTMRIKPGAMVTDALARIEPVIRKYNPEAPFEFSFVDEQYERKFFNETKIGRLASLFAILAIFISCLGLFGLASFVATQRTKEIGVRKVMGATVTNIWGLLSKEFVMLVLISFLIASPIAYFYMHNWLQNYPYHTAISWWIFAAAATGAMLITVLTVSYQAIKTALTNPVKTLRTE